jgi:guanylate kinase
MNVAARGRLVVMSGPSGVGKTTVLRKLLAECPLPLRASVSATTRPPRPGEIDGVDYHFLSDEEFHRRRQRGEFLECYEVYGSGWWYGTLKAEVASGLESGVWVVLGIDVHGAFSVVDQYPDAITIFLRPSSLEELERRLRGRGTEDEASIQRRLQQARHELALADWYRHQVINDDLDRAVREICQILSCGGETRHV